MSGVDGPRGFAPAARDIGDALRFFTRAPIGEAGANAPLDINRFAWAAPVAGAMVGVIGALALVLTGPIGLPPLMRAALATGADRAIRIDATDDQLDGDLVARALKGLVEKEKPDLVLLGKQQVEGDSNQVGQLLAEHFSTLEEFTAAIASVVRRCRLRWSMAGVLAGRRQHLPRPNGWP